MAKIFILGGYGYTGKLLARHLLEESDAEIVIAGRHLDKASTFTSELNAGFPGERVKAIRADAANSSSLRQSLDGSDLLLVAAPTTQYTPGVIQAALDAGVDYLDIQFSWQKVEMLKARAEEIERAGRCFITEAGYHPGLPSAMVRYAATCMDSLETALTAGYLNIGPDTPYSEAVDELMEGFKHYQAQVFKDGAWTKPGSYEMRKFDFGAEIGVMNCYSMFFEELRALPDIFPTLKEAGFYISGSHWVVDWLITPLVMLGLKIAPQRGMRPLGRLMWWGMQKFPRPPYLVELIVEASGKKDGKPMKARAGVSHPDGYELTAIPVVAALLQYLDGSCRRPGLWMMGQFVEPRRLFDDMKRMGAYIL